MLVPGVLSGSRGPLLYPPDEVRKSPDDWNHIPIVVYHPMKDGKPVSARSPAILSRYGVGFVFHSRTDSKGVLKGEGWLDVEATRRVDKSVLDSVQLGKPLELSTGLFVDDEPAPDGAIFNDHRGTRKYVGIARNYKPDHLAILPSGKGACSLADGCGVLINEAAVEAYQVIVNELEAEAVSLYFPDLGLDLLTANKFNPNQPRDRSGKWATVAAATKKVEKAQGRVTKAQAALEKAKATLKVEKSGLLVAKKGLSEAKAREKAKSPAASKAIDKAKASTGTAPRGRATRTTMAAGKSTLPKHEDVAATALATVKSLEQTTRVSPTLDKVHAAVTAAHPNATKEQIKDVLVGLHKDRQIVLERFSGPQHQIPPAVKAVAITGKDLGRDSTHQGHTEYHTTARIPTGGSRPTTGTPAAPKPAASPGARTGKGSKVAQSIVGAVNGGASNLKEAYNAVKKDHPDVTLGQFHDHVKALHDSGHISLREHTGALATLPSREHAVFHEGKAMFGVTSGSNTTTVKSAMDHKPLPSGLTQKLGTFAADSKAKDAYDVPTMNRAHDHLKQFAPHMTEGQFHDVVRKSLQEKQVRPTAWTQSFSAAKGEKLVYMDREMKNYLHPGDNAKKSSDIKPASTPATPRPAASLRAGKSGKSVDEHHAETEALTRSSMSHQDVSKAVDSHIAGLNKSLNKAQTHELGQKLGLTHPKSATKKSVLDGIRTHIHARRGARH